MHIVQSNKTTMDNIKGKSCLQIYEDTYTEDEYLNISWPAIEYVLNTFLNERPGQYAPIKYEEIYCHIYKCVCKDYRERLYGDLIAFVSKHIDNTCKNLQNMFNKSIKESNHLVDYLKTFYLFLNQYKTGTGAILAIFHYLNINYVRQKLGSDLSTELNGLITTRLIDSHIIQILDGCLKLGDNFEEISNLINALYLIKKDYACLNKVIFKKYSKAYSDNLNECLDAENSSNIDINGNRDITANEVDNSMMDHDDYGLSQDGISKLSILNGKQRKRHADDRTNEPRNKMFC